MKIKEGLIIKKVENFGIIFDTVTKNKEFYNGTAIDILSLCDGNHTINQIIDILATYYDVKKEEIKKDLLVFIKEQQEKGIIV